MDKVAAYHFIMSQDPLWADLAYELEKSAASFSADDIRRKMEAAQRLANDPSASASERATAAKMAERLRSKLPGTYSSGGGGRGGRAAGSITGPTRNVEPGNKLPGSGARQLSGGQKAFPRPEAPRAESPMAESPRAESPRAEAPRAEAPKTAPGMRALPGPVADMPSPGKAVKKGLDRKVLGGLGALAVGALGLGNSLRKRRLAEAARKLRNRRIAIGAAGATGLLGAGAYGVHRYKKNQANTNSD